MGATAFGYIMGKVRKPARLLLRTLSLTGYSALLAGVVTVYVDAMLGALPGHTWAVFGALWLYAMAVAGAVTGVAAAFGTVASMLVTLFLVIVGNAAAAGPVGRPLLSGFYSTFTMIVPQGSGVARCAASTSRQGAQTPLVTLAIWGAAGCLLAVLATASRVNYRALYERFAGRAIELDDALPYDEPWGPASSASSSPWPLRAGRADSGVLRLSTRGRRVLSLTR